MQNVYAYHLKAKQKSGKPSLFIWFEAKNDARAKRDLENHIEDAELDQSAYFKPVRANYPVVDDLPPEAAFCDTWCLRYKLDDNLSWQVIPATEREQVQEPHKPAGDAGAPESGSQKPQIDQTTNDGGDPAHGQEPRAYFAKMSADTRAVAVILHGFEVIDTVLSKSQMTNVINTALSGESAYIADMLQALRLPAVSCMDPERFAAFVAGVARRYEETDPESTFINIRKYVEQLLKPAPEPEAETTKTVHKRGYTQTHDALDREIACALWVGDVDCQNIAGEIDRWAQKKIKNDDEDFKRWSMALRAAPNILKYSRETIFGVVRNVPSSDMYHFPATLRGWIEKYLSEHGVYEFGAAPDAVHLVAEPEPEPELVSLGGGRFDVSTLFEASPLAAVQVDSESSEDTQQQPTPEQTCNEASNDGEKAEVTQQQGSEPAADYAQAYFEPGRYADISNTAYHAANGISSTQVKDARISLMYYHGRHVIKTIGRERSDALTFGSLVHTLALEPENLERDFNVEPVIPEGAFTNTASMRAFIEQHNETLPKMADTDTLRTVIDEHNAKLPTPYALGGNADEIGRIYSLLPPEFQTIPDGQKFTATAMKACIKEYNSTLPEPLKVSGGRDALLEQLAIIDPEFAAREVAIPAPLSVSGNKEDMAARIKTILPTAIFADELLDAWKNSDDGRQLVTQQQMQHAKAIQRALFTHPSAGPLLQHEQRAVEASYFGFDEETGLEVRVRPDLEIDLNSVRVGVDLKSVNMGRVKQDALRAKLHREIIDRDYHLSAAMYSDIAAFDQFFWIFVNKDEGYHWVAIVEASPDLLELGRLEYKKALRDIKNAFDTDTWPAPITEEIVDDLNDYDQRRMEALRVA
ncbi:Exodeoxyribonuclease 8 [Serratia liquefaciens]|uniref:RecE family exodeoxyribonuclease n=1 Tax=Serratia liquefaciens TaxID=614 RepID=UPI0021829551|nr:RecE family exodeoxyribonuclease [Serratia liquefaciens]CAI2449828.1 Exodeoxyribonuclease 8 [Serratia liquefaciens]